MALDMVLDDANAERFSQSLFLEDPQDSPLTLLHASAVDGS